MLSKCPKWDLNLPLKCERYSVITSRWQYRSCWIIQVCIRYKKRNPWSYLTQVLLDRDVAMRECYFMVTGGCWHCKFYCLFWIEATLWRRSSTWWDTPRRAAWSARFGCLCVLACAISGGQPAWQCPNVPICNLPPPPGKIPPRRGRLAARPRGRQAVWGDGCLSHPRQTTWHPHSGTHAHQGPSSPPISRPTGHSHIKNAPLSGRFVCLSCEHVITAA